MGGDFMDGGRGLIKNWNNMEIEEYGIFRRVKTPQGV